MTMSPPFLPKKGVVHLFHCWDALATGLGTSKSLWDAVAWSDTGSGEAVEYAMLSAIHGIFWCFLCLHLHIGTLASKFWNFRYIRADQHRMHAPHKPPFSDQIEEEWMHSFTHFVSLLKMTVRYHIWSVYSTLQLGFPNGYGWFLQVWLEDMKQHVVLP